MPKISTGNASGTLKVPFPVKIFSSRSIGIADGFRERDTRIQLIHL